MQMRTTLAIPLFGLLWLAGLAGAPEPAPAAPSTQTPAASPAPRSESSSDQKKSKRVLGYLLTGTVFTEHAMAFPGVRLQIRKRKREEIPLGHVH